jgi:hypothetical protein
MKLTEAQLKLLQTAVTTDDLTGAELALAVSVKVELRAELERQQAQRAREEREKAEQAKVKPTKVPDFRGVAVGTAVQRRKDSPGYVLGGSWENFGVIADYSIFEDPLCSTLSWPVIHWVGQRAPSLTHPANVSRTLLDGRKLPQRTCDGRHAGKAVEEEKALLFDTTVIVRDLSEPHRPPRAVRTQGSETGLEVYMDDLGNKTMITGEGPVAFFCWDNGVPRLIVHADINQEEPTHNIDLSSALEANRKPDDAPVMAYLKERTDANHQSNPGLVQTEDGATVGSRSGGQGT